MLVVRSRLDIDPVYLKPDNAWSTDFRAAKVFPDFAAALAAMQPFLAQGQRCDARPSDPTVVTQPLWKHDGLLAPTHNTLVLRCSDPAATGRTAYVHRKFDGSLTNDVESAARFDNISSAIAVGLEMFKANPGERWDVAPSNPDMVQGLFDHPAGERVAPPLPAPGRDLTIVVAGGVVQEIVSNDPRLHGVEVTILDKDVDLADESEIVRVPADDGSAFDAVVATRAIQAPEFDLAAAAPAPREDSPAP